MNRFEYKKRFDLEMGMYVKKHIYGEGLMDIFKLLGRKLLNKTVKEGIKKGSEKAIASAVEKSGNYAAKRAGDKIVQLLSKNKSTPSIVKNADSVMKEIAPLSQYEIDERVNRILSGGKLRKMSFM